MFIDSDCPLNFESPYLEVSRTLEPHERRFFMQWVVVKAETPNWPKSKEHVQTAQHKWNISVTHTLIQKTTMEHCKSQRWGRALTEMVSSAYGGSTTLRNCQHLCLSVHNQQSAI